MDEMSKVKYNAELYDFYLFKEKELVKVSFDHLILNNQSISNR